MILTNDCILGIDFMRVFGVKLDFDKNVFTLRDVSDTEFAFSETEYRINDYLECSGIEETSESKKKSLDQFFGNLLLVFNEFGETTLFQYMINVKDHGLIKQRYYLVSPKDREVMYEKVDRMLTEGIIEPSNSPWSTLVVMIKNRMSNIDFV